MILFERIKKLFERRSGKPMKLVDRLSPGAESVQFLLRRKRDGKTSGLYLDGEKEIRSPDLKA